MEAIHDPVAIMDATILQLQVHLTYYSAVMMTVCATLLLWLLNDSLRQAEYYRWWLKLVPAALLLATPTTIGLIRLISTGDGRLLAEAPDMTFNLLLVGLIVFIIGGGLCDALFRYRRGFYF